MLSACHQSIDLSHDRELLLASNEQQRRAHMENAPGLLSAEMADTVITVQRGQYRIESRENMEVRWENYFASVKYLAWDDLEPPHIEISKDGSLASVSVRKMTIASMNGGLIDITFFAWTTGYKKISGAWRIYKVTSTRVLESDTD